MDGDRGAAPDPEALERVRRDLADLGADAASAPEVPAAVTARIVSTLRAEPAHSVRRPRLSRPQVIALVIGAVAAVVAAIVGVAMLAREPAPAFPHGPTAELITVSRPAVDPAP